jgi:hypothetical protein
MGVRLTALVSLTRRRAEASVRGALGPRRSARLEKQ